MLLALLALVGFLPWIAWCTASFHITLPVLVNLMAELLREADAFASKQPGLALLPPIVSNPQDSQRTIEPGEIPQYCVDFAPVVHLYLEERYLPYDVADFVRHFHATRNGSVLAENLTIDTIGDIEESANVYLTADTDFDADPDWITGVANKPNLIDGAIEKAPAVLVVVDKGNGWVDAYWFYFYSFNLGPFVMGAGPYGNHVGDWEHLLVRFHNGVPQIVWMLAHGGGAAFKYHTLEKYALDPRHPVIFSAYGTHANYALVGQHPHDLPYNILLDFTDRGDLWNPLRNYLGYTLIGNEIFYGKSNANKVHLGREEKYGNWLAFAGHWGDAQIPMSDPRQKYNFIGGHRYIDGPTGPLLKNLARVVPCERHKWWNFLGKCKVRSNIRFGIGVELEGYNCGHIFEGVRPQWLKRLLQQATWGGVFCFIYDVIY